MTQNCVFPPEIDDKQLMAYLDGQADESTILHLKACAYCHEKADTLDDFQKDLTTRLYKFACPPPLELGEYHLRLLPAARMLIIGQHVRECPSCAREVAQLEGFLSDPDPLTESSVFGKAKVLIAHLVGAGTAPAAPVTALRGGGKVPLTFATGGLVIVLDVQPASEGRANILGQVAAQQEDDWTAALVELWADHQLQLSSTADDLGAFQYEGVMPGRYELRMISRDGSAVVIPSFQVPD